MDNHEPTTRTMTMAAVEHGLPGLVEAIHRDGTRVILEQDGIPVAALVSIADAARLQQLDRQWDTHTRALERFSAAFADVPTEEAEAEVARIIADIRREDATAVERRSA